MEVLKSVFWIIKKLKIGFGNVYLYRVVRAQKRPWKIGRKCQEIVPMIIFFFKVIGGFFISVILGFLQ